MKTNYLNVEITRPNVKVFIMRGVSGSGKSTLAKEIVFDGVIHSTDETIKKEHDYNNFFEKIRETNDSSELSRAHSKTLKNFIESVKNNVGRIVIDNMNIKKSDIKLYIKEALKLGVSDENIFFINVGTNGLTAEELTKRSKHINDVEKIKSLIQQYNSQGDINIKTVMESKDRYKESNVLYTGVMLDEGSKQSLLFNFEEYIPKEWIKIAHHMTISFNKPLPLPEDKGKRVTLRVTHLGISDLAIAVKVNGYPSLNEIPHITLAVEPNIGKPYDSNKITNWVKIKEFNVTGVIDEILKKQS